MSNPRRTQAERRATTRRRLLDAAATLFAEHGYHAVSLDRIAAHAGLTRGALHHSFAGKEALLRELLDERLAARGTALPGAAPTADGIAGALPFDRDASLLFLEFAGAAARDPQLGAVLLEHLDAGRRRATPAVADLLAQAGIDRDRAEDAQLLVAAFVNGLAIEALAGADLDELDRRFRLLLDLLLGGLRAG